MRQGALFIICAIIFGVIGCVIRVVTRTFESRLRNWINDGMLPSLRDITIRNWMQTYGNQGQNIVFTIFSPHETYHARSRTNSTNCNSTSQYLEAIWVIIRVSVGEPNRKYCESNLNVYCSASMQYQQQWHANVQAPYPMQVQQGLAVGQHDQMQYVPQQQVQQVTQPYCPNIQAQQMQAAPAQGAISQVYVQQSPMQQPYQPNQQQYTVQYSHLIAMQQAYTQQPLPPSMQFNQNNYTYNSYQQAAQTVPSVPPKAYKEGEQTPPPAYN